MTARHPDVPNLVCVRIFDLIPPQRNANLYVDERIIKPV
jgi:hypothetical protein